MKTLSEIAYNVLNLIRGGRSSNNEYISEEQIKYVIMYYRSLLIRRDSAATGFPDLREFEQSIPGLVLDIVDPADGGSINITERGFVLKTAERVPTPIRLTDQDGITSVHSSDFRYAYPVMQPARARWTQYSRWTKDDSRSYYREGHVYVTGSALTRQIEAVLSGLQFTFPLTAAAIREHPVTIEVRGVFEDPRRAYTLATGEEWDDDVTPFPLSGDMEQRIIQSLMSGEFKITGNDVKSDNLPDHNVEKQ